MKAAILSSERVVMDNSVMIKFTFFDLDKSVPFTSWVNEKSIKDIGFDPDQVVDLSETAVDLTFDQYVDKKTNGLKSRLVKIS